MINIDISVLKSIENEMQIRYRKTCDIYTATKEVNEHLMNDDRLSAKMQLKERAIIMDDLADSEKRILQLLKGFDIDTKSRIMTLVKGGIKESALGADEKFKPIIDLVNRTKTVWERTVEIDKVTSTRIMGKSSFYSK